MTLMRKFLDILNMDNWQPPKNIEPDPNPNKPVLVDFPIERPKEFDIAPVLPINPASVSEEPPSTVIVSTFTPNTEQANGTKLNINYEVDDFVEDLAPYILSLIHIWQRLLRRGRYLLLPCQKRLESHI